MKELISHTHTKDVGMLPTATHKQDDGQAGTVGTQCTALSVAPMVPATCMLV